MPSYIKWILGLTAAYLLAENNKPKAKVITKPSAPASNFFYPPVEPIIIRNDPSGQGHFHASRKRSDGTRYLHNGLDLLVEKDQSVSSPINGKIIRPSYPYKDRNDKVIKDWKGVLIQGTGRYEGYLIWIWYFVPVPWLIGHHVLKGDFIGTAQDISLFHGKPMLPHLHIQVKRNGKFIDPLPLLRMQA